MYERPYDLVHGPAGYRVRIRARGGAVLASAMLNRGTAFTEPERRALGLTGLLPSGVTTLASQLERVYAQYGLRLIPPGGGPGDAGQGFGLGASGRTGITAGLGGTNVPHSDGPETSGLPAQSPLV
jgi:hypothetical protein